MPSIEGRVAIAGAKGFVRFHIVSFVIRSVTSSFQGAIQANAGKAERFQK